MEQIMEKEVALMLKRKRRKKFWTRVVSVMMCLVVFCTTYALILPAITMETDTFCGKEAHTHTEECYSQTLLCPIHVHTEACSAETGSLVCTLPESAGHTHTEECQPQTVTEYICGQQENPGHTHSDACMPQTTKILSCGQEEVQGHTHTDACLLQTQSVLNCGLEESTGHTHTEACTKSESVLTCGMEETAGHSHTQQCSESKLVCGQEESETHTHDESCYSTQLICGQEESVGHSHGDGCYETVVTNVCGQEESAGHTHSDSCYLTIASYGCGQEESAGHTHTDACYTVTTVYGCGMEENAGHAHSEACTVTKTVYSCGQEESTGHTHGDGCYAAEEILNCTLEADPEHTHTEQCYDMQLTCQLEEHEHSLPCFADPNADVESAANWEATLPELTGNYRTDVLAIAKSQLGYSESKNNYIVDDTGDMKGYTRYGAWYGIPYGDWCAMYASFCLDYAGVKGYPLDANCPNWIESLKEKNLYRVSGGYAPQGGDLIFFDWNDNGLSDHVGIVVEFTPADENTQATVRTIEGNSGNCVQYHTYSMDDATIMGYGELPAQLTEEEQAQVDRVIALIDEMPTSEEIEAQLLAYEEAEDMEAYEEYFNAIGQQGQRAYQAYQALGEELQAYVTNIDRLMDSSWLWSMVTLESTRTVNVHMVNDHTVTDGYKNRGYITLLRGGSADSYGVSFGFNYWTAIVVEESDNGTLYVAQVFKDNNRKNAYGPTTANGFVLYIWQGDMETADIDVSVGDLVSVSFDYSKTGTRRPSGSTATSYGTVTFTPRTSNGTSTVKGASTSEFVELNIYDYYGADTAAAAGKTNINNYWNGNKKYPGFQWNGGAYMDSNAYSIVRVDNIDLGNSMITDFSYGSAGSSITNGISSNYQKVGRQGGIVNEIVQDSAGYWANLPTGISNGVEVMQSTLKNGYPALSDGTSLQYLFTESSYASKKNTKSIDGLFQQDSVSGEYWYDSRDNHAYYSNNKFTLYNQIITPNFILYPFGNFLPFNNITDPYTVTQVTDIDHVSGTNDNTDPGYMQMIRRRMEESGMDATEKQLYDMLGKYQNALSATNQANWKAENAINYYFRNSAEFGTAFTNSGQDFNTTPALQSILKRLYNIDFDVKKNFFFGMEMKMNFMQPRGGMTGNDNDNDGQPDYPMVFYFAGDDDVWVYMDNILFLDLTGIHRHVGGEIDFVNGVVNYYAMESYIDGAVSDTPYHTMTFAEVLMENGGVAEADLGNYLKYENGKYTTFKDYSSHSFNFYYMERGSGSSVCRINFNFPLLRQNTISVSKENVTTDGVAADEVVVGNPDYYFNLMSTTPGKLFVGPGSVTGITEYTVEDSDGNPVLNPETGGETFTTDQYGIFKLKAGQTAYFKGIKENAGEYYVQELIREADNNLYPSVYVNDVISRYNKIINWGERPYFVSSAAYDAADPEIGPYGSKWYGRSGQDADPSTSTSYHFEQQNRLDVKKLGKLSITKKVEAYEAPRAITYYKMYVTLDGEPLPKGTTYDVNGSTREVTQAGYIEVAAGETATISNIISGTKFLVREDAVSAAGYTVTYQATGASKVENDGTCISGVIHIGDSQTAPLVEVLVTNAEHGASVKIPVTKSFRAGGEDVERIFTFTLEQVEDATGETVIESGTTLSGTITTPTADSLEFLLNYYSRQFTAGTHTFYYKITETDTTDDALPNEQVFIAEVTVTKTEGSEEITAEAKLYPKGESTQVETAAFVNTLTGQLKLEKVVDGGTEAQTNGSFTFTVQLDPGTSGVELKDSYPATVTQADGTVVPTTVKVENGVITVREVHHGESIVIHDLPIGTQWTVTETGAEGYVVKTAVTVNGEVTDGKGTATGEYEIVPGQSTVVYTNQQLYELPETGGTGTYMYTMAGLTLMLISTAFLLYRCKKRGREVS